MKLTQEQKLLAEQNENLIWKFLRMYGLDDNLTDDLYGLLACEYCKACANYDPQKGKLSTIAFRYMKNGYFKHLQTSQYHKRAINSKCTSLYAPTNDDGDSFLIDSIESDEDFTTSVEDRLDAQSLISKMWQVCSQPQREFIAALYDEIQATNECCYKNVGKAMGITGEAVRQRRVALKHYLESEVAFL